MGIFKTRLPPEEVDALRDSALALEESNLELAARLMNIAKHHRPDGHLITQKCEEYSKRLRLPAQERTQVQETVSKDEQADRSTKQHKEAEDDQDSLLPEERGECLAEPREYLTQGFVGA